MSALSEPVQLFFIAGAALFVLMTIAWLAQRWLGHIGFMDVAWSMGVGFCALLYGAMADGPIWTRLLVALMGGVWSFRLALYLLARTLNEPQDGRYRALMSDICQEHQGRIYALFMAKGALAWLFSVPFLVIASQGADGLNLATVSAVVIWLIAVIGESVADYQLAAFRSVLRNRYRTCQRGLWRYSRHPNYFFELMHWMAYVPLAWGLDYWWLTLLAPILMSLLIFKLTGIPPTERQAANTRGESYRRYQDVTNTLIPWFRKNNTERE